MTANNPRISLTKQQRESVAGAELLALCQTVTSDGRLSNDEVVEIIRWLKQHRNTDLPAVDHLVSTVERIVADRRVTKVERRELYRAIERVLPPEARKEAVAARRDIEQLEREVDQLVREEQRTREREEQERTRPVYRANFMVAGVHYEGRADVIEEHAGECDSVYLVRDRANRFSRNAVEVRLDNGLQIGFVPEDDAVDMAPYLDDGAVHQAYITKILAGGRAPIPVVQAYLFRADCGLPDVVAESDVPSKAVPAKTASNRQPAGCAVLIAAGLGVVFVLGAVRATLG